MGVPLAVLFGLFTLGFGFALFPFVVAATGFLYRTATIAGGSATWGMRFVGIELRRGDGSRFDLLTAVLHTGIYMVCISVIVLQAISCLTIVGDPLPPEPRRHHPRHHGDQLAGRLSRASGAFTRAGRILLPARRILLLPFGAKGECHPGPHMRHSLPQSHQFYVTAPQPCPYLAGKVERKLFTALQGEGAVQLNDVLSHQGFRRSQNVLYRPSCAGCSACLSARIVVRDFRPRAASGG